MWGLPDAPSGIHLFFVCLSLVLWLELLFCNVPGAPNHKFMCLSLCELFEAEAKSSYLYCPTGHSSCDDCLLNCTEMHNGSSLEAFSMISDL